MTHPLLAALLVAALAFPAAAQDAPLVVKIVSHPSNATMSFLEGDNLGPSFRAAIKGDGVAPKGGLTVRMSYVLTATGQTGQMRDDPVTIPEGMTQTTGFYVVRIPADSAFHACNKMVVILESVNPDVYRIAPYRRGEHGQVHGNGHGDDEDNPVKALAAKVVP